MALSSQSENSPLNDRFDLEAVIRGLAGDLQRVRDGRMTIEAARANAEIAKQLFNGVRLVVSVQRTLEGAAKQIGGE